MGAMCSQAGRYLPEYRLTRKKAGSFMALCRDPALVLFGKRFWQNIINLEAMAEEGVISNQDLDLVHYVETAEEAWSFITNFYK